MATFVNDLRLKEITTGDESGTWGTSTNTNLELIAEAFSYSSVATFDSDADKTETIADGATDPYRSIYVKVTSGVSLTATRTLTIAPNDVSKIFMIENATSGSQSIAISQGSGANVTIPNGDVKVIYTDGAGAGAAVVDAFANLKVTDAAQTNITSVGALDGGSITSGFGSINVGSSAITTTGTVTGTTLAGTLSTAAQTNITSVGTLSSLDVAGVVETNDNIRISEDKFVYSYKGGTSGQVRAGFLLDGTNQSIDFYTAQNERVMIDSSGNVGIGTASPSRQLQVENSGDSVLAVKSGTSNASFVIFGDSDDDNIGLIKYDNSDNSLAFRTNAAERMRISSGGLVGIGTSSPAQDLHLFSTSTPIFRVERSGASQLDIMASTAGAGSIIDAQSNHLVIRTSTAEHIQFETNDTEVMRLFSNGDMGLGGQAISGNIINSSSGTGVYFESGADFIVSRNGGAALSVLRQGSDGQLVRFKQAGTEEGNISVSGATVSYNGFSGNHETSGIPANTEIGTVCSTIDELDTYVSGSKSGQTRADHAKIKVSDAVGDSRVYGVLASFSEADNKPIVASVGIGSVKVTGACSGGDLLESNGDGTAKVQSDDIIRSKTIGKVTIGNSNTGVKLVSCVLYCG